MKTLLTRSLALAAVAGSLCLSQVASAAAVVSYYGSQIDTPRWRSTDYTKTIQLSGGGSIVDSSGYYGKSGYLLPSYSTGLPTYAPSSGLTGPGTAAYASLTYAQNVDDPTQPISGSVAPLPSPYWAIAYQAPGASTEVNLYNFTLSGTIPSSFLLGLAYGNLDTPSEDFFGTASFRASINGGGSTAQIAAVPNNKLIDWMFFKVDNAIAGDTFNLYGTSGTSPSGGANVAAVSFDPVPVPEPSTFALLGLGGLGLAVLRRRRKN